MQQVSLKIPKLVKLDQALLKIDVLLLIDAKRDDILRIDGKPIRDLVIAPHRGCHFFDHALSETTFFEVVETCVGVFVFGFVVDEDALGELCSGFEGYLVGG